MNVLYIEGRRNGYDPDQCGKTMTVSEMIEFLSQFDGDLPIYLNNDSGATSTSIASASASTMIPMPMTIAMSPMMKRNLRRYEYV